MTISPSRPSLLKSTRLNFFDGAISLTAAALVSVLLARGLGPTRFGLYALTMSVVTFAFLFARFGISGTVRRYVAELDGVQDQRGASAIAGHGIRLGLLSGAAGSLLLAIAAIPLSAFFRHEELRAYLLLGAVMLLPMVLLRILRNVVSGFQQYRYLVLMNLVTSPLWVLGCGLAVWRGAGVMGVLAVTLLMDLVSLVLLAWWVTQHLGIDLRAPLPEGLRSRVIRYNVSLAILLLLEAVVWQRSEVLFLGRFQPASQISFYAVPFALTERVTDLIPGAILGVLLPGLAYAQAAADPEQFRQVFRQALRYLGLATLPLVAIGIPLAPVAIRLLYGPGFEPAAVVFQILLVSVLFGVLGQAARNALLVRESQSFLLKTGAVAAVASIVLDFVLIPQFGAIGAAIANTAVQAGWALAIFAAALHRSSQASSDPAARGYVESVNLAFTGFLPPDSANPEERTFVELLSSYFERTVFFQGIGVKGLTRRSLGSLPARLTRKSLPASARLSAAILPLLPIRTGLGASINAGMIRQRLLRLTTGAFSDWTFWTRYPSPELVDAIRDLPFRRLVYEPVDNYAAEPELSAAERRRIESAESELASRAMVVTASSGLARRFDSTPGGCHWLPIGHDARLKASPPPAAVDPVPRPRLALTGSLDELADEPILARVATSRPDWNIILAGPRASWWGRSLDSLPNVHWLGQLSPAEARGVVQACDLALNPCVNNEWTRHAMPVKIFDYLAEGRPVVSTRMSELDVFGDLVTQASPDEFGQAIARAMASDNPQITARRIDMARRFTIQERARRAFELLTETPVEALTQRPA